MESLEQNGKNGLGKKGLENSEKSVKKTRKDFMQKTNTGVRTAACLAASVLFGASASASIIYDNSSGNLGQVTPEANQEIGDVVNFSGTDRFLNQFEFEYFLSPTRSGNETAQAFIYANDGAAGLPGTLLYSSPVFNLGTGTTPAGYGHATLQGFGFTVPDSVTWTVKFSGVEGTESAGLLFYSPPAVGSSPTYDPGTGPTPYTVSQTSGWNILDHPGVIDNLGARFTAIPEPGTWAILAGGLATLGVFRRRKA